MSGGVPPVSTPSPSPSPRTNARDLPPLRRPREVPPGANPRPAFATSTPAANETHARAGRANAAGKQANASHTRTHVRVVPGTWLRRLRHAAWLVLSLPLRLVTALLSAIEACITWLGEAAGFIAAQPAAWEARASAAKAPGAPAPAAAPATSAAGSAPSQGTAASATAPTPQPPAAAQARAAYAAPPSPPPSPTPPSSADGTPFSSPASSPPPTPPLPKTQPAQQPATPLSGPAGRGEAVLRQLASASRGGQVAPLGDAQLADVLAWLRAQLGEGGGRVALAAFSLGGANAAGLSQALRARADAAPSVPGLWTGLRRAGSGWGDVRIAPAAAAALRGCELQLADVDEPSRPLGRRLLLRVRFAAGQSGAGPRGRGRHDPCAIPKDWLRDFAQAFEPDAQGPKRRREAETYGASAMLAALEARPAPGTKPPSPALLARRAALRQKLMAQGDARLRIARERVL